MKGESLSPSPVTTGAISDPAAVAELLGGRCALCGLPHTGFGHDRRSALSLASCRCGATYHHRGATTPDSVTWYRASYRVTNAYTRTKPTKRRGE